MTQETFLQWRLSVPYNGYIITELVNEPDTGQDYIQAECYGPNPPQPKTWTLTQDAEGNLTLRANPWAGHPSPSPAASGNGPRPKVEPRERL